MNNNLKSNYEVNTREHSYF